MAARRFVIQGIVQGVGFRHATRREAQRLGLRGWVRNRADGTVEAVAVGTDRQLDAFERWLNRGPPASHVEAVQAMHLPAEALAELQPVVADDFRQVETAWN